MVKRNKSNLNPAPLDLETESKRDAVKLLTAYFQKNQHLALAEALIKFYVEECKFNLKEVADSLNLPRSSVFVIIETIKRKETADYEKALFLFLPAYRPRREGYDKFKDPEEKRFHLQNNRLLEAEDTDLIISYVDS